MVERLALVSKDGAVVASILIIAALRASAADLMAAATAGSAMALVRAA